MTGPVRRGGSGEEEPFDDTVVVRRRGAAPAEPDALDPVDEATAIARRRGGAATGSGGGGDELDDVTRVSARRSGAEELDEATRVSARRAGTAEPDDATHVSVRRAESPQTDAPTEAATTQAATWSGVPAGTLPVTTGGRPVGPRRTADEIDLPDPDDGSTVVVRRESRRRAEAAAPGGAGAVGASAGPAASVSPWSTEREAHAPAVDSAAYGPRRVPDSPPIARTPVSPPPALAGSEAVNGADPAARRRDRRLATMVVAGASGVIVIAVIALVGILVWS